MRSIVKVLKNALWTASRIGIVIPGSRIPGSRDPGRFSQSRIPGLAKPKSQDFWIEMNVFFSWNQHISHDICYKLEKKLFSHTMTVTLISPPATMLQVATAFFHSWLTRPIATNERYQSWDGILWQYCETRLLFGDSVLVYLLTVPPTSVEAERAFSAAKIFTTKLRSWLSDNSVDTSCFLCSFYLRTKPKCNKTSRKSSASEMAFIVSGGALTSTHSLTLGSPDCCTDYS